MVPCGKVRYNDDVHKASSYYMEAHMKALSDDKVHSFATVKTEMATVTTYSGEVMVTTYFPSFIILKRRSKSYMK
jgi:hypothetical protein